MKTNTTQKLSTLNDLCVVIQMKKRRYISHRISFVASICLCNKRSAVEEEFMRTDVGQKLAKLVHRLTMSERESM
jgi:hypothetical protein